MPRRALAALAAFGTLTVGTTRTAVDGLDGNTPLLDEHLGIIGRDVCDEIIAACNEIGWAQIPDSIDGQAQDNSYSQDLYVFDRGKVVHQRLWDLIRPYVPTLADLVLQRKRRAHASFRPDLDVPVQPPSADWIFIRKYSPEAGSTRNSLRAHTDTNEHSINVPLNSDMEFEGGGFFVIRPPPQPTGYNYDTPPEIPASWMNLPWLSKLRRENSSAVYFPRMTAGMALLHNSTVFHGIAPLESGVKYSLLFFFDMPPEDAARFDYEAAEDAGERVISLRNDRAEDVDVLWLRHEGEGGGVPVMSIPAGASDGLRTSLWARFEARGKEGGELIASFQISADQREYVIGDDARKEL